MTLNKKRSFVQLSFFIASILTGSFAQAKTIGNYEANIYAENAHSAGRLATFGLGWYCSESTNVNYVETVADHKGRAVDLKREEKGLWSWQNNTSLSFQRDFYSSNPVVNVSILGSCRKSVRKWNSCASTDSNGRCVGAMRTRTYYASYGWYCDFRNLPISSDGQSSTSQECVPRSSGFGMNSLILAFLNEKKVAATISLKGMSEELIANNCDTSNANNKVYNINFSQGVGGHMGENDFEFVIGVDGQQARISTETGLISGDIKYCARPGETLANVQILDVKEKDKFFDDVYELEPVRIDLRKTEQIVTAKRKSYSFHVATPKKSQIKVRVTELKK